jgi:hypothetical protein
LFVAAVIFDCFGVIYWDGVGRFCDKHPSADPALELGAQVVPAEMVLLNRTMASLPPGG